MKKFLLLLFLPMFNLLFAQEKYSISNDKAIRLFEHAIELADEGKTEKALGELQKATQKEPRFVEAWTVLGDLYSGLKQPEQAIACYRTALKVNAAFYPNNFHSLAEELMKLQRYAAADTALSTFLKYNLSPQMKAKGEKNQANARFAIYAMKHPVPFTPINLGSGVNSRFEEYLPAITADENRLVFTVRAPVDSNREAGLDNPLTEDFYESTYENGQWKKRVNLGPPINTPFNEGAENISPDGQTLLFTSCANAAGEYPQGRQGLGRCDIFFSVRTGKQWSKPRNIGKAINSAHWESQPCISSDGSTLFFVSNRPGGKGREDLYCSRLQADGTWGPAENLGDSINTSGTEISPFIHPDNLTLYFSSDGWPGMGKKDLYMCRRKTPDAPFGKPVNLGYPINGPADESALVVSADGIRAYYDSERKEGLGKTDIYRFDLHAGARPQPVTYVKGIVRDKEKGNPVEAAFELTDLATGKAFANSYSDARTGEYLVCLPSGHNYAFTCSKQGYLFYSENFSLPAGTRTEPYVMNVDLSAIKAGQIMVMNNIFFATGEYSLKNESSAEIEKLAALMKTNPGIRVEIGGHTDNVGDKQKNQTLSENRAKAVVDFLVGKNIPADRIVYKGYGDTQPVAPNDSEEGRRKNRRTECKIL